MGKNLYLFIVALVLISGFFVYKKLLSNRKQVVNLNRVEKKITKDLGLKEGKVNAPIYPKAKVDIDKCGKDAFYIEEKSADFVKNYCRFLRDSGWQINHPDYKTCEDIKSSGGGYNYDKGSEKIAVSVIRYGAEATCFWVFGRK